MKLLVYKCGGKMVRVSFKKELNLNFSNVSLTTEVVNIKNHQKIELDNKLTNDFILLLEFDAGVAKYYEQPFRINYKDGSCYVPDFYVKYKNGNKDLIWIREKNHVIECKTQYDYLCSATSSFCEKNNMTFKIIDDDLIKTEKLFNAKFLFYYLKPQLTIPLGDFTILYDYLKNTGKIPVNELVKKCAISEERRGQLIYVLWWMLAHTYVNYDVNKKLTMGSLVWIKNKQ